MAGKKKSASSSRAVAAACCLLMALMLLLSAQQQPVAAMSAKFCRCYRKCYTGCRKTTGPYPCNVECFQDCVNGMPPPAPTTVPAADCRDICQIMGFCGSVVIVGDDAMDADEAAAAPASGLGVEHAEACVADCTNNMGAFAPSATKIN